MEGKIYEIPLDISSGVLTAQIRELVTEDMGTNTFRIKLVKNKHVPFPLAGTIVRMMVKTPSGARIQQECTIENAVGGTVSLTLKQSLLLERGLYTAELQIYDAITQSIRLTTPTFTYHVRESLQNSESIVATDEYTILQQALADLAGINIIVANKADKDYVDALFADIDVSEDIANHNEDEKSHPSLIEQLNQIATDATRLTTDKTVTGAINELFTDVSNGKSLLETTLLAKNAEVSKVGEVASFVELDNAVKQFDDIAHRTYLYNEGDECTGLTGGWETGYTAGTGSQSKEANHLLAKGDSGSRRTYETSNIINLSGYTKLYSLCDVTSLAPGGGARLFINTSKNLDWLGAISYVRHDTTQNNIILELDISSINNSVYVTICGNGGVIKAHKIWLE